MTTDLGSSVSGSSSSSSPSSSPTIFDLITNRRWDEARGYIDLLPSCCWTQNAEQHRTPLHVLCRMRFAVDDEDKEEKAVQGEDVGDSDSENDIGNNNISGGGGGSSEQTDQRFTDAALSVAKALLEASHHRTAPHLALHPIVYDGYDGGNEFAYDRALHNSALTVQDVYGDTPLHGICGNLHGGNARLCRLLLESTADYDPRCSKNMSDAGGERIDTCNNDAHVPTHIRDKCNRNHGENGVPKPRTRTDGKALPTVYDLMADQNFHGLTVLHQASDGVCPENVMDLILDACYRYGDTGVRLTSGQEEEYEDPQCGPVVLQDGHHGKRFRNGFRNHPLLISDEDGDLPLHYACSAGLEAKWLTRFAVNMDHRTGIASSDAFYERAQNGRLPIDDLITWCIDQYELEANRPRLEERMSDEAADALWTRMEALLEVIGERRHQNLPVHTAAKHQTLPSIVLRMACRRLGGPNGQGLLQQDYQGFTPLHSACYFNDSLQTDPSVYALGSGEYLDLSRWGSDEEPRTPIQYLIGLCPDALHVRCREENRLPLHLAVCVTSRIPIRFSDIEAMLDAAPDTIFSTADGLYPFQIASADGLCVNSRHYYLESIDMTFRLLLKNPELVRSRPTTSK